MKKTDKLLFVPILVLGIYLIVRLINQSQLLHIFPLDYTNDISSYMANLFFLKECGFHNFCPYWYNGFISFGIFPLGWSLFTLPIYLITNNILTSTFISIILMYIISFIFIYIFGKFEKFSLSEVVAFFLFFFANAIAIGDFLRLGRTISMFAFTLIIGLAVLTFYYRKRRIDSKFFLLFIPLYFLILISHIQEAVLAQFLIMGLFLTKNNKDKIKLIIFMIIGFVVASFWLLPFIFGLDKTHLTNNLQGRWGLAFSGGPYLLTTIAGIIIPIVLLIMFYFYFIYRKKSKKELLFFLPILLLNILFLLKLTSYIPILSNISPHPYTLFFMFFIFFFFFKSDLGKFKNIAYILLLFIAIINVVISAIHTPYFITYTEAEKEMLSLFPYINERFIILESPKTSYSMAYYSYAPIFHNLSTASGWYKPLTTSEYLDILTTTSEDFNKGNCNELVDSLIKINTTEVLVYGNKCEILKDCKFKKIRENGNACLYSIQNNG